MLCRSLIVCFGVVVSVTRVTCVNFDFESVQLRDEDVADFPAIAFGGTSQGNLSSGSPTDDERPACKAFPGTEEWPLDEEWAHLNKSLDGALLKPIPPAAVCYNETSSYNQAQCDFLEFNASQTRFYIDNPLSVLSQWIEGDTCPGLPFLASNCTQGGFPTYVVNATTVKHVQIAVNFARNRNIRIVIK
jgi:hypothetical protein